jgi:hypothetical protein
VPCPPVARKYQDDTSLSFTTLPQLSLTLAFSSIARPLLLDEAKTSALPQDAVDEVVLESRKIGTTNWVTQPDTRGVWESTSGTYEVRIAATLGADGSTIYSAPTRYTVKAAAVPTWLRTLNSVRATAGASPVAEYTVLSKKDAKHVNYLVHQGYLSHEETKSSKYYTKDGDEAGRSSDLALGGSPITQLAAAPFHALSLLSRTASVAGYAAKDGYGAVWPDAMFSTRGQTSPVLRFPAPGKATTIRSYSGGESEWDFRSSCRPG